ncbi:unnamed protein product [Effrenium voratum]|nr:unnamed protein product [Effrenium voratum]
MVQESRLSVTPTRRLQQIRKAAKRWSQPGRKVRQPSTIKRLQKKGSSLLDVRNSPRWLRLDSIHTEHVKASVVADQWILSNEANLLCAGLIGAQALLLGVEISLQLQHQTLEVPWMIALLCCDACLLLAFAVEYVLRACALGTRYMCSSGIFDVLLLLTGIFAAVVYGMDIAGGRIPATLMDVVRSLRFLRILRIVRVFQFFPALSMLIKGFASTTIAILDTMALIAIFSYAGALLCCEAFSQTEQKAQRELFSSVIFGWLTHIRIIFVEAWPDIAEAMMVSSGLWGLYTIVFLLTSFALLSVIVGVVCEGILDLVGQMPPKSAAEQEAKFRQIREEVLELLGERSCKDTLKRSEYVGLLRSWSSRHLRDKLRLALPEDLEHLENLLDTDHSGSISVEELQEGLLRLRGSRSDSLSLEIQCVLHQYFWLDAESVCQSETMKMVLHKTAYHATERISGSMDFEVEQPEPSAEFEDLLGSMGECSDAFEALRVLCQTATHFPPMSLEFADASSQTANVPNVPSVPRLLPLPPAPPAPAPPAPPAPPAAPAAPPAQAPRRRWGRHEAAR